MTSIFSGLAQFTLHLCPPVCVPPAVFNSVKVIRPVENLKMKVSIRKIIRAYACKLYCFSSLNPNESSSANCFLYIFLKVIQVSVLFKSLARKVRISLSLWIKNINCKEDKENVIKS